MKPNRLSLFLILFHAITFAMDAQAQPNISGQRLCDGWEFQRGHLGGIWEVWRDPRHQHQPWSKVTLPHCFNAFDAVDPDEPYYQGEGWYRTLLDLNNPYPQGRTLLHFEGAGQKTRVFLYTRDVGQHVGGYDEFTVDLTEAIKVFSGRKELLDKFGGKFPIAILCDNSRDLEMIPSDLSDFNLYGGLYRYVNLIHVPALSIKRLSINAGVDAKGKTGALAISAHLYNPLAHSGDVRMVVEIFTPSGARLIAKTVEGAAAEVPMLLVEQKIKRPALWSPAQPNLYECRITLTTPFGEVQSRERFGFRHFEFREKDAFYLNGRRLLLRGTHRHEDHAGLGAAMSEDLMRREMKMIKDMGANFIRLGHYQQSRIILDQCDSLGLLVWEEIPWCRGGLGGDSYRQQARRMLTNMIQQHRNHPAVILWGLGNENDWEGDFEAFDKDSIRAFMAELHGLAHQLDPSRLTSIRRCAFCADIVDVYSPSIWAGWYRGVFTEYKKISWNEMNKVPRFFHAEWGGDSHAGRFSENPLGSLSGIATGEGADERAGDYLHTGGTPRVSRDGDWSESYFCDLADWHLKEQETMAWLTGAAQWIFKDFSTPLRPENPVPYVNQKGVVQRDLTPKEGYYVFQSYWSEKPMVRLFGHDWDVRSGAVGEKKLVKVYSNCKEVELFLNGVSQGVRVRQSQDYPAAGLRWQVEFAPGRNHLRAVGRMGKSVVTDEMEMTYQTEPWGTPRRLRLALEKSSGDTALIKATLVDSTGRRCLDGNQTVRFGLSGEGLLLDNLGTVLGSRVVQLANGAARIRVLLRGGESVAGVTAAGIAPAFLNLSPRRLMQQTLIDLEKERVLRRAKVLVGEKPVTVVDSVCSRSSGGSHDYYSEGDYWWPDPENPDGAYIRKDGINNPDNFNFHRNAIGRLSWITGTLTSAWLLTGDEKYVQAVRPHLRAWFIDAKTRMNPHLLYAQAIKGRVTGRGIGIIDATSFIEVAQSVRLLQDSPFLPAQEADQIKVWFREFLTWLRTHPYGIDEMNWKNNHGTWWHAQAAAYASLVGDDSTRQLCRQRLQEILIPKQMAGDGSFPLEIERTKPYSYSLFNLDGMAAAAWILSDASCDLFGFALPDGRGMRRAADFMLPYVGDKGKWPFAKDVSHWEEQPGRRAFLVYAALAYERPEWIELWRSLDPDYRSDEARRNAPIKNVLLWIGMENPEGSRR